MRGQARRSRISRAASFCEGSGGLLTILVRSLTILALLKNPISDSAANDAAQGPSCASAEHAQRFRSIYEAWCSEVGRWIIAMGGRTADRDDLVQDVFLVVFRRLPDFDGKNLAGWLYQITRRRVRDFRRSTWLRRLFFGSTTLTEVRAGHGFDPSQTLETAQKRAILERLLETLNEPERVALVLFEIEDYSGEEIAELQGVPINTVWARIRRARIKMCNALEKFEASAGQDRTPSNAPGHASLPAL